MGIYYTHYIPINTCLRYFLPCGTIDTNRIIRKQYPFFYFTEKVVALLVKKMMNPANNKVFGTVETTQKIGISPERLRYWERVGIVRPKYVQCGTRKFRKYCQEDIHRAVVVKILVDNEKYTLEGAMRRLEEEGSI